MRHNHRQLITALALGSLAGCGGTDPVIDAGPRPDAYVEEGTITLTWTINDSGEAITCEDVYASAVTVISVPAGGGIGITSPFVCSQGSGTTQDLPEGSYLVTVELSSSRGELDEIDLGTVAIADQADVPLTVDFEVLRRGNLEFQVSSTAPGPNCTSDDFGAGITEMVIELQDADGVCIPGEVFEIAAGADTTASTYTSDCAGTRHPCIEKDQVVTVTGTTSGPRKLSVVGLETDTACYLGAPGFDIPGADLTTDLGTVSLLIDTTAGTCTEP